MHKTLTALVASSLIASCSPADLSTMGLLRAGDAKVCIASDVERTLEAFLRPKDKDASAYTIAFDAATLETFDKVVTKAECHANLKIDGPRGEVVGTTGIDYAVLPSAQDPANFVVSTALEGFRDQLAAAIDNDAAAHESEQAQERAVSELAATVKPGWLIGRWVTADQGLDACSQGPYQEFLRDGRFRSDFAGRWKLSGLSLSIIGPSGAADGDVSAADAETFALENFGDSTIHFRRCSRQDMATASARVEAQRRLDAAADAEATRLEKAADEMERLADEAQREANARLGEPTR